MTQLIGILNITPDSFSDGGKYLDPAQALSQAEALMEAGAAMIDIGAESTRPGATPLTAEEEWQRLAPVLPQLAKKFPVSLDSYHPETIAKALALGIAWVNDVTGFTSPAMAETVRDSAVKLVVMHNLGVPADPACVVSGEGISEILHWAETRITALEQQGIARHRIVFDPGIGFGKTAQQSLNILKSIDRFQTLGVELLVGHSRKSCFSLLTNSKNRDTETLAASLYLADKGVNYLRVHDIAAHRNAFKIAHFLRQDNEGLIRI